jgi:hypothetical protein
MVEKEVLFPESGPREIEEQRSHLEADNDQKCAKDTVHGQEGKGCIKCRVSTDGLLESSDAISDVAIVDVHRIDLGKTLQGCYRLTCGFLGNT